MVSTVTFYLIAAIAEIAGCFAFWAWLKLDKPVFWIGPGVICLAIFAYCLTRIDANYAGRAYAAYGGVYIATSLLWLWIIEGQKPDRWDVTGGLICLTGAAIILWAPRPS